MKPSLILKTAMPLIVAMTLVFAIYVLMRGHNAPGGGFIGALIAACGFALYAISSGTRALRRALRVPPLAMSGAGIFIAVISGLPGGIFGDPFMTGTWWFPKLDLPQKLPLGTPVLFDIGVFLAVLGGITAILIALEEDESP